MGLLPGEMARGKAAAELATGNGVIRQVLHAGRTWYVLALPRKPAMTMPYLGTCRRAVAAATFALSFSLAGTQGMGVARAEEVSPKGKGIAGGAMLGMEVAVMIEAIAGVRPWWAYLIGAAVGGGGGGVGGYFLEKQSTDGKAPTYLLAGGLALFIPALVLTINATRYMPEDGAVEDKAPTNKPTASRRLPMGQWSSPRPTPIPASLLDVSEGATRFGVPLPSVVAGWSAREQARSLAKPEPEVRLPLVRVVF